MQLKGLQNLTKRFDGNGLLRNLCVKWSMRLIGSQSYARDGVPETSSK
jgi:hypothetical protein